MAHITSAEVLAMQGETDRPGWAYPVGYTVYWSPTHGRAKLSWGQARRDDSIPGGALGPRPEPCTLAEAIDWGRGNYPCYA